MGGDYNTEDEEKMKPRKNLSGRRRRLWRSRRLRPIEGRFRNPRYAAIEKQRQSVSSIYDGLGRLAGSRLAHDQRIDLIRIAKGPDRGRHRMDLHRPGLVLTDVVAPRLERLIPGIFRRDIHHEGVSHFRIVRPQRSHECRWQKYLRKISADASGNPRYGSSTAARRSFSPI